MVNTWIVILIFALSTVAFLIFRNININHYIRTALLILCISSCAILLLFERFEEPVYDYSERTELGTYDLSPFYVDGEMCYLEETKDKMIFSYMKKTGDDEYAVESPKIAYDPKLISYSRKHPSVTLVKVTRTSKSKWLFLETPFVTEEKTEYELTVQNSSQIYYH